MRTINTNNPVETVPYGKTVIPDSRLKYLEWKCRETLNRTPGNIVEVGVYKGGIITKLAKIMKEVCPQYKVYGIDTFSGHPYSDNHPVHPKGKYADVSKQELDKYIKKLKLDDTIELFQGRVENILKQLKLTEISFAHIDCDLYTPIKFCANNLPRLMKKHSVIYFDDYNHEHCPGATKAINDVFRPQQLHQVYIPYENTCWSAYVQL